MRLDKELLEAAERGDARKIRELLGKGANPNTRDEHGWTPLHKAAFNGHLDVARLLLEHGADVNARSDIAWTPLHAAAGHGHAEVARLLLDRGADVNARDTVTGWTPLHLAALNGHVDVARLLLDRGADVNAREEDGLTPLHWAAMKGYLDVARLLLEHGADVNARNKDSVTPLHIAAGEGHVDVARLLLEHGAYVNARSEYGLTPLYYAAVNGRLDVVRLLLEHGADPGIGDDWGRTPLDRAREGGYVEVARVIEEYGRRGAGGVPARSRAGGGAPVKVAVESRDRRESGPVSLEVGRVEAFIGLLVGRPVQLSFPSPGVKRLEKVLRLGGLECRGYLSAGGLAAVVICVDEVGVSYAVKIPSQFFLEMLASGAPTRMGVNLKPFLREVEVLKSASGHPCILRLHGFLDSPPALIFELCKCSLRDVLKGGGLGPVKAAEVLVQVADALAFLHSKGYVHGDVKPENILFSFEGVPKLSDFNTAKALAAVSRTKPGYTPGYAAPEQLRGEKLSEKADSWALGLILYEAATGKPLLPLDELGYEEALAKLERGKLAIETTGSKEIDELVKSCIKVNPAKRLSAAQVRDALAKYLAARMPI